MRCHIIAFVHTSCLQAWGQCKVHCRAFGSTVLSLFQRNIPDLSHSHSMAERTVQIGGIENMGNSCIFAVMLQDFAALPHVYDPLLFTSVQQGLNESQERFVIREAVQQNLRCCIANIRAGGRVRYTEIRRLAEQLQKLGWQGHPSSAWRYFLYRLAPSLFPLPHFDVYPLYETTLNCLLEQKSSFPMVLTGKKDARSFSTFFASHAQFSTMSCPTLWRVALDASPTVLEEQFQIDSWQFSLQILHASRNTSYGKHVIVYRKNEGEWICCNDTEVTCTAPSAQDNIYMAVYESRLV